MDALHEVLQPLLHNDNVSAEALDTSKWDDTSYAGRIVSVLSAFCLYVFALSACPGS